MGNWPSARRQFSHKPCGQDLGGCSLTASGLSRGALGMTSEKMGHQPALAWNIDVLTALEPCNWSYDLSPFLASLGDPAKILQLLILRKLKARGTSFCYGPSSFFGLYSEQRGNETETDPLNGRKATRCYR